MSDDQVSDPASETPRDLAEEVSLLRRSVLALNASFKSILRRTKDVEESVTRSKKAWAWTQGLTILDLALTVGMAVFGFLFANAQSDLAAQNDRLERVTARLEISMRNQCAQLALFLGSYRPESRPPDQREEYERNFANLRFQFKDLACDPGLITRPTQTPTVTITPTPAPAPTN